MTRLPTEAWAAFSGSAWVAAQQDSGLQAAGAENRACRVLEHRPDTLAEWVSTWRTRCQEQPRAIGLALPKGPRVSALRQHDCLGLWPVPPLTLARYREACTPSQAQDAPTAAERQRALLRMQRAKLQPWQPQRPTRRALAPRMAARRRRGGDQGRLTPRRTRTLKNAFPHVLPGGQDQDTPSFCDFLTPWPPLQAVPLARRSSRARVCRDQHGRSPAVINPRLRAIPRATPLTLEAGVHAPGPLDSGARHPTPRALARDRSVRPHVQGL